MDLKIKVAKMSDYPKLKAFAEKVGVEWPEEGINTRFFMLEDVELAASVGVSVVEEWAILRALIIDPDHCGLGEAISLLTTACKEASIMGARGVYLLTTVPSFVFQFSGFSEGGLEALPESLKAYPPFNKIDQLKNVKVMYRSLVGNEMFS